MSNRQFNVSGGAPVMTVIELDQDTTDDPFTLGTRAVLADGREYVWGVASAAIAAGEVVQQTEVVVPAINAVVDAVAAIGSFEMTGTGDFSSFVNGGLEEALVYIDGATGAGQLRWIKKVLDDDTIEVTEAWTTALDATSTYIVFGPYKFEPHAAAATGVPGVAQSAITSGSKGWIQTAGFGHVLVDGSQDPLVANRLIVAGDAVAGTAQGFTTAGVTAGDNEAALGYAVIDVAALDILAPVMINPGVRMY